MQIIPIYKNNNNYYKYNNFHSITVLYNNICLSIQCTYSYKKIIVDASINL